MTKTKILTAVVLLSTAVAAPAFAKARVHHQSFRNSYNQVIEPSYAAPGSLSERNLENFGISGRDPSRVGGFDPSLNPSGS
jgi:hypothetical protein